jgi:type IV secretory pathway VirB10-like protein
LGVTAAVPAFWPLVSPKGEVICEILAAIAAVILGAEIAVILIIAIIIIAIIALIIYLLRDTKKYPDRDTKTEPKDKTKPKDEAAPKEEPDPKKKPDDPPPPPPLPDERPKPKPDCCPRQLQPEKVSIDKRHRRYGAWTVKVHDGRGKHWKNIKPENGATCDVDFLEAVLLVDPNSVGPCLRQWIKAVEETDTEEYGGQMGSDSAPNRKEIVKNVVENGDEINTSRYWGDAGEPVGVDVSTGRMTTMAHIRGLPDEAHVIPEENRPT